MYIQVIPNRGSPPAILLRESYREGGKVKKRTLCNLTHWPPNLLEGFKALLKGATVIPAPASPEVFVIRRALPHGHVAAALGTLRQIGLDRILGPDGNRCRDLVIAMVTARLTEPTSKLATAKALSPDTASSSLGAIMGLGAVDEDELYTALDWLAERQAAVEAALARRHLRDGTLVLYDVSSSYVEGRCCELARRGYDRDGKRGKLQIVYGLLCAPDGCPIAVEVFEGNTADPMTLSAQVAKLKGRFGLAHVVLVGDRGLITQARIEADLAPAGLDWITALRAPALCGLVEGGALQLTLFDARDMAAITSPDYPGERLIVCRNPDLARERARKRKDLLQATERDLARVVKAVSRERRPLCGRDTIGLAAGAVLNRHKVAKHFALTITDETFGFARDTAAIAAVLRQAQDEGGARRLLRRAHQPARDDARRCRHGAGLQVAVPGGARLPQPQGDRPAHPARVPLAGAAGAGARVPVPFGVPGRVAPAPGAGAAVVRGRRPGCRRGAARERGAPGATLAGGRIEADPRDHGRRAAGAQLRQPDGGSGDADPQHGDDPACGRGRAHRLRPADAGSGQGLRAARGQPRAYP